MFVGGGAPAQPRAAPAAEALIVRLLPTSAYRKDCHLTSLVAAITAIGICAGAAALEGMFAGPGVRRRLDEVSKPRFSPPFGGWIIIGLAYYALCGVVLYRLLQAGRWTSVRVVAVVLLLLLLVLNASWNLFFFRRRDLRQSFLINIPYAVVALAATITLFRIDRLGGWLFAAYLVYLIYAVWFGYRVWQLNARGLNVQRPR